MRLRVHICKEAEEEHDGNVRQYAHTMHHPNTICLSRAFYRLLSHHKLGILLHELGHLAGAVGEREADQLAQEMFGVKVRRVSTRWGEELESVDAS